MEITFYRYSHFTLLLFYILLYSHIALLLFYILRYSHIALLLFYICLLYTSELMAEYGIADVISWDNLTRSRASRLYDEYRDVNHLQGTFYLRQNLFLRCVLELQTAGDRCV